MNMMSNLNLRAMVTGDNGQPMTTSYAVAEAFNKRHSDVLRAIKNMRCSDKFRKRNFAFTLENKKIGSVKRDSEFYRITERGFMFLVMGFTGAKADAIKESFIDAFEWMASQLERVLQSDMVRYNQISLKREQRKQHVSCSAKDMRSWQDEKPIFDAELARLEHKMQPCLNLEG